MTHRLNASAGYSAPVGPTTSDTVEPVDLDHANSGLVAPPLVVLLLPRQGLAPPVGQRHRHPHGEHPTRWARSSCHGGADGVDTASSGGAQPTSGTLVRCGPQFGQPRLGLRFRAARAAQVQLEQRCADGRRNAKTVSAQVQVRAVLEQIRMRPAAAANACRIK